MSQDWDYLAQKQNGETLMDINKIIAILYSQQKLTYIFFVCVCVCV